MILRSLLFAPGNVTRRVEKALGLNADAVILDLEDAVPLTEKAGTRNLVAKALKGKGTSRCYVRVNALSTGLTIDDIFAVTSPDLDGILLPKVEEPGDLIKVDWFMAYMETKLSLPLGSIDLIPLVENAKGVNNAFKLARTVPRVKRLCFGAVDYSADIGVKLTIEGRETFYARSQLVNSSRAAGIEPPIDTVYPDIQNSEGLERDTSLAVGLGFSR